MIINDIFHMEMQLNLQLFVCLLFFCIAFTKCRFFICLSFACKRFNGSVICNYSDKQAKIGRFLFACCLLNQLVAGKRGA